MLAQCTWDLNFELKLFMTIYTMTCAIFIIAIYIQKILHAMDTKTSEHGDNYFEPEAVILHIPYTPTIPFQCGILDDVSANIPSSFLFTL